MTAFDAGDTAHLFMLCVAASIAGFIRGFAGFGGPATVSLLLAHFFAPATLLPKIALIDFYAFPMLVWSVRRNARWRLSLPLAGTTIAMMPLGLHTMQSLDPHLLKRLIGGACILAVVVALIGYRFRREPPLEVTLLVGVFFGWLLGTTYIALPIVTYILLMPFSAAVCRATVISFSVMMTPFLIGMLLYTGFIQVSEFLPVAVAGVLYFVLVGVGGKVFGRVSEGNYRRAAQWLLLVLAATVLL